MEMITRKAAKSLHMKKFYTGGLCAKGHDSPRYVKSGNCCACTAEANKARIKRACNMDMGAAADQMVELRRVWVHKDDLDGLMRHIDALRAARKLMTRG